MIEDILIGISFPLILGVGPIAVAKVINHVKKRKR